jgi:hypothetical protein
MKKPFPAFCKDCKHSKPAPKSGWELRCFHPIVNAEDNYALAGRNERSASTSCTSERERAAWFSGCGKKGKLWEPK